MVALSNQQNGAKLNIFLLGLIFGQLFVLISFQSSETDGKIYVHVDLDKETPVSYKLFSVPIPILPKVLVITSTFQQPNQLAQLTRLAQAIYPSRHFVEWILFLTDELESNLDSDVYVRYLEEFMSGFDISGKTVQSRKRDEATVPEKFTPIRMLRDTKVKGVIYSADKEKTYDFDFFRKIQSLGNQRMTTGQTSCLKIIDGSITAVSDVEYGFNEFTYKSKDFAELINKYYLLYRDEEEENMNDNSTTGRNETPLFVALRINENGIELLGDDCTEVTDWQTDSSNMRPKESRISAAFSKIIPHEHTNLNIAE